MASTARRAWRKLLLSNLEDASLKTEMHVCYFTNLHFPIICSLFFIWPFNIIFLSIFNYLVLSLADIDVWTIASPSPFSQPGYALPLCSILLILSSLLVYGVHWIPSPRCNLETQAEAKRERAGLTAPCLWAYMPCFVFSLGCAQIHFYCILKSRIAEDLPGHFFESLGTRSSPRRNRSWCQGHGAEEFTAPENKG